MLRSLRRGHALGLTLVLSGCGAQSELPVPTAPDCFGDGLVPSAPSCAAPARVPTMFYVDAAADIGSLAVDADAVYFTEGGATPVVRVPKCGGPSVPVADPHVYDLGANALGFAVACGNVAWLDASGTGVGGDIGAGPSAPGDQARLLMSIVKPLNWSIGVDVDYVYYGDGALERVPIAGGPPASLAAGWSGIAAVDDVNVYFYQFPPTGTALASIPKSGGDATILVPSWQEELGPKGLQFSAYFAQDADTLYWIQGSAQPDGPNVVRVAKTGGVPEVIVAGIGPSRLLVVDDTYVYWNNPGAHDGSPGAILRAPKTGGSAETVATVPDAAGGAIAVDTKTVYWTAGAGIIMKLDKE